MSEAQGISQLQVIAAIQVAESSQMQVEAMGGLSGNIQTLDSSTATLIQGMSSLEGTITQSFKVFGVQFQETIVSLIDVIAGLMDPIQAIDSIEVSSMQMEGMLNQVLSTAREELRGTVEGGSGFIGPHQADPNTDIVEMVRNLSNPKTAKAAKETKGMMGQMGSTGTSMVGMALVMQPFMAMVSGFLEPFSIITDTLGIFGTILGTALYPILLPINDVLISMIPYLFGFVDWLYNMTENVQVASTWLKNITLKQDAFSKGLQLAISPLNTMVVLYQQIASIGTTNGLFTLDIPQVLKNIFDPTGMGAVLVDAVSGVTDELWSSIKGVFTLERDESLATYLSGEVGRLVDEIWLAIKGVFGALKTKVENAWDDLVSLG